MLLDVGVWLAAVWSGHARHRAVAAWFDDQATDLYLCRVTQMGLLRLLSNPAIMGPDVVTRADAWRVVDQLRADPRIHWRSEPANIEQVWRALSARADASHKRWTDDYLAGFSQAGALPLATLDRKFAERYPSITVETLG